MKIKIISAVVMFFWGAASIVFCEEEFTREKIIQNLLNGVVDIATTGGQRYHLVIEQPFPEEYPEVISARLVYFENPERHYTLYRGLTVQVDAPSEIGKKTVSLLTCFKRTFDNSYVDVFLTKEFFTKGEKIQGIILDEEAFFKYKRKP